MSSENTVERRPRSASASNMSLNMQSGIRALSTITNLSTTGRSSDDNSSKRKMGDSNEHNGKNTKRRNEPLK